MILAPTFIDQFPELMIALRMKLDPLICELNSIEPVESFKSTVE